MQIDNKNVISFCSNDYLGLANHPQIKQATIDAIKHFGIGSGAAHLVNGHSIVHHQLEEELAEFTGYPRALLFSTGYMANLGLCQALVEKGDYVFEDRLNHASLVDGGLISGARLQRYLHNDVSSLKKKIQKTDANSEKLVLTDGVFSMDGDIAKLPALATLCKKNNSWLMVDDAHGFGTLGETGKGSLQHFSLSTTQVPIYMATLGKAMGTAGAFIAGSDEYGNGAIAEGGNAKAAVCLWGQYGRSDAGRGLLVSGGTAGNGLSKICRADRELAASDFNRWHCENNQRRL